MTGRNWCAITGTPACSAVPQQIHVELPLELYFKQAVELCCLLSEDMYSKAKIISHDFKGQCGNCVVMFIFLSQS